MGERKADVAVGQEIKAWCGSIHAAIDEVGDLPTSTEISKEGCDGHAICPGCCCGKDYSSLSGAYDDGDISAFGLSFGTPFQLQRAQLWDDQCRGAFRQDDELVLNPEVCCCSAVPAVESASAVRIVHLFGMTGSSEELVYAGDEAGLRL